MARSSVVHGLDARAKLGAALLLASAAVLGRALAAQAALLLLLLAAFWTARIPAAVLVRALRNALWLVLFVAVANAGWFVLGRATGWNAGEGAVGRPAELGLLLLRLVVLLVLAGLFTATTVPVDAAEALQRLLEPLRRLRVPVTDLGLLLVLALSFVPILWREARRLADAHRMKVGLKRWRFVDRARAAVPLLVPLFLGALRRADELAVALDARCFVPGAPRTTLVPGRAGRAEAAALVLSAAALALAVWLGR